MSGLIMVIQNKVLAAEYQTVRQTDPRKLIAEELDRSRQQLEKRNLTRRAPNEGTTPGP